MPMVLISDNQLTFLDTVSGVMRAWMRVSLIFNVCPQSACCAECETRWFDLLSV